MGFDLWTAVGISPMTALAVAAAAIVFAGLLALRMFVRGRRSSAAAGRFSLMDR